MAERQLPEHVTTPLLALITARSMDEDYAHVARQRATSDTASGAAPEGSRPGPARPKAVSLAAVAALGVLMSVAVVQTDRGAATDELGQAALRQQIGDRREQVRGLQDQLGQVTSSNRAALSRSAQLRDQLDDLDASVTRLGVRTGFTAVHGEGVRITVDNPPGADVNSEVRDEDLAVLVDGLWQAGAEAVAINDQRINVLGGIRNTSRAIHVNGRPVNPPYDIAAIGDTSTLQARFLQSSQGQEWFALVNGLDFRYSSENVDDVRLPAAPDPELRDVIEIDAGPNGLPEGEENAP